MWQGGSALPRFPRLWSFNWRSSGQSVGKRDWTQRLQSFQPGRVVGKAVLRTVLRWKSGRVSLAQSRVLGQNHLVMLSENASLKNASRDGYHPNYLSFPPLSFHRERALSKSGTHALQTPTSTPFSRKIWVLPCDWRLGHLVRIRPDPLNGTELVALDVFSDEEQLERLVRRGVYVGFLGTMDDEMLRKLFPCLVKRGSSAQHCLSTGETTFHELFVADVHDHLAAERAPTAAERSGERGAGALGAHGVAVRTLRALLEVAADSENRLAADQLEKLGIDTEDLAMIALRDRTVTVTDAQAALLAQARILTDWYHRNRFCTSCGNRLCAPAITSSTRIGRLLQCSACEHSVYPRIDPVVIVLVVASQSVDHSKPEHAMCLLGRKHQWQPGRYSCIAGFVEAGETLEEAVVREVAEETGILLRPEAVRYASSQTWPFPSQLMLGFYASVPRDEVLPQPRPSDGELESVAWFSAGQVRAMLAPEARPPAPHLPPREAIAHRLIVDWLQSLESGAHQERLESVDRTPKEI